MLSQALFIPEISVCLLQLKRIGHFQHMVSVVKESSQTTKVFFLLPKYNQQVEVKVKKQDGAKYKDPPRSSFLPIISPIFYCGLCMSDKYGNYLSVTKVAAVRELDHSERFLADTGEMAGTGQSYLVFSFTGKRRLLHMWLNCRQFLLSGINREKEGLP